MKGWPQLIEHEPDLAVDAQADSAGEALRFIEKAAPDLLVVDISLPDKSGLELIKDILVLHPRLPILVISMHDESLYAERVLRAGGRATS